MNPKINLAKLLKRMRLLEVDHAPDGWPAVQMRDITALCDAAMPTSEPGALYLLAQIREALGDNGKRMQPELIAYCRELVDQRDDLIATIATMSEENSQLAHRLWCLENPE